MKKHQVSIILVSFFILAGAAFSFWYYYAGKRVPEEEKVIIVKNNYGQPLKVRPFSFIDQEGDTITQKAIKNKIAVVEYFFTTCKGICPKMNENMNKVYQAFRNNNDVVILSHTVDPANDTVAAMKAYSMRYDADPKHWMFLTGDKQALYDQARNSYLISAVNGEDKVQDIGEDFIHSNIFALVDKEGRLRMHRDKNGNPETYDGTSEQSVAQLIEDIKTLEKESN
jgi:protein SCO1/2